MKISTKQNKAKIYRFIDEAYNKRNLTVGDELLATNVVLHVSNADIEGQKAGNSMLTVFLPDFPT